MECFARHALDMGAKGIETLIYLLIATVYLVDIADCTDTIGAHGGNKQGYTCADVGRRHLSSLETESMVMAIDDGTVRITEDNLGTHVNEFIHKE